MANSRQTSGTKIQNEFVAPYDALGWQMAPLLDKSLVVLLTGSAGGGKSRTAAEKVHAFCKKYPGAMGLMMRKNRQSMTNSTVLFFAKTVMGDDPGVKHYPSKHRFEYANGSILAYGGMADDQQREQIRSIGQDGGLDFVWMEEANRFTEDDYNEVLGRMRGSAAGWRQVILTTNPDTPTHWIKKRLMDGGEAAVYYSKAADNTYNPKDYLSILGTLTGVLGDRLNLGKWITAEGAVYDNFRDELHVIDPFPIPATWRRLRAVDFGFTNPFVCLWVALDDDGRMYVYREIYKTKTLVEDHTRRILELSQGENIEQTISDHDAEDRATMERYGIYTIAANKAVSPGLQAVRTRLDIAGDGRPRLFFFRGALVESDDTLPDGVPHCAVDEMSAYSWPKSQDGKIIKEQPVKANDHACLVGETIVATPNGPANLCDVVAGDYVLGRHGYVKVLDAAMTHHNAPIWSVTMANNVTLRGTYNHPVYTENKGFSSIDALRYGDMVWYNYSEERSLPCYYQNRIETGQQKLSFIKGLSLDVIPNQRIIATDSITRPTLSTKETGSIIFTGRFTKTISGKFHRGTKFTTRTATRSIMSQTILSACPSLRTPSCTKANIAKRIGHGGASGFWKRCDPKQLAGTNQKRGVSGIANMVKKHGKIENHLHIPVNNVGLVTKAQKHPIIGFAPTIAKQQRGAPVALITKPAIVSDVEMLLKSTNTTKRSIALVPVVAVSATSERAPVYNLTVEGGEYFANGILVHNCDALRYLTMYVDGGGGSLFL